MENHVKGYKLHIVWYIIIISNKPYYIFYFTLIFIICQQPNIWVNKGTNLTNWKICSKID